MKRLFKITIVIFAGILSVISIEAKYTEAMIDITGMSIRQLQQAVDEGRLNYETITRIYLDRIEAYADDYNVIISINEQAIEEAKALDVIYKEQGRNSEVFGMPILVKDNIDVKGMPTTAGAKGLINNYPIADAPLIENLREAGVIFLAKTNMDEFAFNGSYSRSGFGLVKNGFNPLYSSYGSSGGSAVGVALELAVAALGSDTGVSIRIPSSASNLVGLRPTKTTVPEGGIITFESERDVVGPMAKSAEDAALIYSAMTQTELQQQRDDLTGVVMGILTPQVNKASGFIQTLFNKRVEELKSLGATVINVASLNISYAFDAGNFCYEFNQYIKGTQGPINSLRSLVNSGEYTQYIDSYLGYYCDYNYKETSTFKTYLSNRNNTIQSVTQQFNNLNIDVLIYPTMQKSMMTLDQAMVNNVPTYSYMIAPQTGFPSINVPMGFYEGLPYGMEMIAKTNEDYLLLEVTRQLESQTNYQVSIDAVPALYEPMDNIDALFEILAIEHEAIEYEPVMEKLNDFLVDYIHYDDKDATAQAILEEYENVPAVIQENKRLRRIKLLKTIGGTIVVSLGIGVIGICIYRKAYQKKR